jgi:hypothetical protein
MGMGRRIKVIVFFYNALNMIVFHHKRRTFAKINILITLLSLWAFTVTNGSAAATTGWGDIVDVNYSLWTDAAHTIEVPDNIDVDLTYIYLSRGSSVPESLQTVFPSASASYIAKFKEELIGIEVGAQKDFMIPSEDAYQDGRDLYYRVILLRIHHDASSFRQGITGGDAILILGVGGIVAIGGILYWRTTTSKQRKQALSSEGMSSARREKSIKQKKSQLRELRELAESRGSEMDVEKEPPKQDDVKFRRRR